jgi:hypothetical protein
MSLLNVSLVDVLPILKTGVFGLGFLLALFAFRLLAKEQAKESPSNAILKEIRVFMAFSVVLCAIGLVATFAPLLLSGQEKIAYNFAQTCEHIRTTNWLDGSPEARKSLSQWCETK